MLAQRIRWIIRVTSFKGMVHWTEYFEVKKEPETLSEHLKRVEVLSHPKGTPYKKARCARCTSVLGV